MLVTKKKYDELYESLESEKVKNTFLTLIDFI